MKLKIFFIMLVFTILEAGSAKRINNSNHLEDNNMDCQVKNKHKIANWTGNPITFLSYVGDHGAFACSITYQGVNSHLVHDKLILSQQGNTIHEFRSGNVKSTNLDTYLDVSGWTQIEISMHDHQVIMKYWDAITLNHTITLSHQVKDIILHGSNITMCDKKTPTWFVEEDVSATIPLEPSKQVSNHLIERKHHLTLRSNDDFTPCFAIHGNRRCLTTDGWKINLVPLSELPPLPAGKIDLYLTLITGFVNIYKEIGSNREDIIKFPIQGMRFIEVTSFSSNFSVTLNVFGLQNSPNLASTTNSGFDDNEAASTKAYGDSSHNHGKYIGIGISIGLVLCVTVVIGYKKLTVVIGYKKFWEVTCKAPWKKQIKDGGTRDSTKPNHATSSELINLKV